MEKVLVCLLASTRAHQLTFPSFKRQVLDELNGDLALALTIDEKYDYANPFWQHAKYRWTAPDFSDVRRRFRPGPALAVSAAQRPCSRLAVDVANQGQLARRRIRSPDPQPSRASILIFCRWLLLHGLQQDDVLDRYDRFVITRSDFVWLCSHPPLSVLDREAIWFPDGEHYGGFNDRHFVASRADVVNCLNILEDILLHPIQLYEEMKPQPTWNIEQFLAYHLSRKGLRHKVKLFPYVMYLARSVRDEPLPYHGHRASMSRRSGTTSGTRTSSAPPAPTQRLSAAARTGKTGPGCNSTPDLPLLVRFLCRAGRRTPGSVAPAAVRLGAFRQRAEDPVGAAAPRTCRAVRPLL